MSRDIYFFKRPVQNEKLNAVGDNITVFDQSIAAIQEYIKSLKLMLFGDGSVVNVVALMQRDNNANKGVGLYKMRAALTEQRNVTVNNRDSMSVNFKKKERAIANGIIASLEASMRDNEALINRYEGLLATEEQVTLPAAIALKAQHEMETYDATFANSGNDVKHAREKQRLEGEAAKKLAESEANIRKLSTQTSLRIQETTANTTKIIVIVIVVVAFIVTAVIIRKKLKKK